MGWSLVYSELFRCNFWDDFINFFVDFIKITEILFSAVIDDTDILTGDLINQEQLSFRIVS